ncbi:MAG: futalosine hydrolase [Segetibacter sp.]
MKVVITSATEKETLQIKSTLNPLLTILKQRLDVSFHIIGVGIVSSCFSIAKLIFEQKPDLIIQAGIAGTFDNNMSLGKVVIVKDEIPGDTGVEENGGFNDLFDLNLQQENEFPFTEKRLRNCFLSDLNLLKLEEVTGITINEITTRQARIEELKAKYQPEIESMEGASLHYCCLQTSTPFIQVRAISNYIGERDKSKWRFRDAFDNLSESVLEYIHHLDTYETL